MGRGWGPLVGPKAQVFPKIIFDGTPDHDCQYQDCGAIENEISRSLFLRFVWGRTRLPRSIADFRGRDFVLQILDKYNPPDDFLPESYTCFFLLKMPRYSGKAVLRFVHHMHLNCIPCFFLHSQNLTGRSWSMRSTSASRSTRTTTRGWTFPVGRATPVEAVTVGNSVRLERVTR